MKIFINPGHSCDGTDPGACYFGLRECDVALNIATLVTEYLRAAGLEVELFQADELWEIVDAANYWNSDLFISIHCNAAENSEAEGTETYHFYDSSVGRALATAIHDQLIWSIPIYNRGVKEAGFTVISETKCPAVLVETAFLSNEHDATLLTEHADDFARAIARGVTDFLRNNPLPDVLD